MCLVPLPISSLKEMGVGTNNALFTEKWKKVNSMYIWTTYCVMPVLPIVIRTLETSKKFKLFIFLVKFSKLVALKFLVASSLPGWHRRSVIMCTDLGNSYTSGILKVLLRCKSMS